MKCELCEDSQEGSGVFQTGPCVCWPCAKRVVEKEIAQKQDRANADADNLMRQKRKCEGCKYDRGPVCLRIQGVCWEYQGWTPKGGA